MSGFKRCPFCKLHVAEDRDECPKCKHLFVEDITNLRMPGTGSGAAPFLRAAPHSMGLAIACAICVSGGGQLYNGQQKKGQWLFLCGLVATLAGVVPGVAVYAVAIVDAILVAQRIHRGEVVAAQQWF